MPEQHLLSVINIGLLQKNTLEEIIVPVANSKGFLEGWIFVLDCWGIFGVGFLAGGVEQIGIEIWFVILTLKEILLETLFLHFHTSWVTWFVY